MGCWDIFPSHLTFTRLTLKQKMFQLNHSKITDYFIRESDKGGSKWLNVVSQCQCKIVINSTGVFLRENISNGFWVTSNKAGKDNMWPLQHYSVIYFLGFNIKVLIFMLMEAHLWQLLSKQTSPHRRDQIEGSKQTGQNRRVQIDGSKLIDQNKQTKIDPSIQTGPNGGVKKDWFKQNS